MGGLESLNDTRGGGSLASGRANLARQALLESLNDTRGGGSLASGRANLARQALLERPD